MDVKFHCPLMELQSKIPLLNTVADIQVKLLTGQTTVNKPIKPSKSFTSFSFHASQD